MYKSIPKDVESYRSYQYHGNFDQYVVINDGFMHGKRCIVFTDIHDTLQIFGRKCEFRQNEGIYSYGEIWDSDHGLYCKYFLINSERTLKYSITD